MKNKIIFGSISFLLIACSSCKKNLDSLFQKPDAFTTTSIELLFPTGESNSFQIQYGDAVNRSLGSFAPMMQVLANLGAIPTSFYQYNQTASGSSAGAVDFGRWGNYYNSAMPALKEIEKIYNWQLTPDQQKGYKVYYELTKIVEAYNTAQTTDLFGDMPYSEAFTARNSVYGQPVNLYPKFDKQQDIYDSILTDLKAASDYLDTAHLQVSIYPAQAILGTQDILFAGDLTKWNRLANSLRLRYAMRISAADQVRAKAEIADIVNNSRPLILDNANNAYLYNIGQTSTTNLFRAVTEGESAGTVYAPAFMDSIMVATADPRLQMFYYTDTANHGTYTGMPATTSLRTLTTGFKGKYAYLNPLTFGFNYSMPNGVLIDAADVNYLLAEAAKKGYITGGDATAAQYYNAGITQSILAYYNFYKTAPATGSIGSGASKYTFNKLTLPVPTAGSIATWLAGSSYAYNAGTAMAQIAMQKWMHTNIMEMDETFAEFRRLGLPLLPADIYNGQQVNATYPVRVPYPASEGANNVDNFNAAATATNNNSYAFPVWWDK